MVEREIRVVFITGVSSGIGRAAAVAFARQGIHVIGVARREDKLESLAAEIAPLTGEFLSVQADVSDEDSLKTAAQAGIDRFGRIDSVVANAGIGHRGNLVESEWSDIEAVMRINMDGVLHTIRVVVPFIMQGGKGGRVVIISSIVFNMVSAHAAVYAASKAFVSSIARSLRLELKPQGIGVVNLLVGRTETEFNEKKLGQGASRSGRIPVMTSEYVAERIVDAALGRTRSELALRWTDRLIVWVSAIAPGLIGRLAERQYR